MASALTSRLGAGSSLVPGCSSARPAHGRPVQRVARCPGAIVPPHSRVSSARQALGRAQRQQQPLWVVRAGDNPMGSLKETAALDDLIDRLLTAKSQQQVSGVGLLVAGSKCRMNGVLERFGACRVRDCDTCGGLRAQCVCYMQSNSNLRNRLDHVCMPGGQTPMHITGPGNARPALAWLDGAHAAWTPPTTRRRTHHHARTPIHPCGSSGLAQADGRTWSTH